MTDGELIAALAKANTPSDLLMAVASRLARKASKKLEPTEAEIELFERLWKFRQQFARRPGDPKKPALLKFCAQMREKAATFEEISFGIRCEYSAKKDRPELYAQMETFINQRRWETYDYAGDLLSKQRREQIEAAANVTPIRWQEPAIDNEARARHAQEVLARAGLGR